MTVFGTLSLSQTTSIEWDLIVIGAGVAGAVAARELARRGRRVLLVDKREFPRRKVCGACLNGTALNVLDSIGLRHKIESLGGHPISHFALRSGSKSVELPLPHGLAVSREALDASLIQAAIDAGADFLPNTIARIGNETPHSRSLKLDQHGSVELLEARSVVVATGLESTILTDLTEWKTHVSPSSRLGAGCTLQDETAGYSAGTIWMAVGAAGYVGLVRVEDDRVNIAAALDRDELRRAGSPAATIRDLLKSACFQVPERLFEAEWQGTLPLTRQTTPVASRRVFLIGDAAGYVEPFTGEGMTWALQTAVCVTPWIERSLLKVEWQPELADGWKAQHRTLIEPRQRICHISTRLLRSQILVSLGLTALSIWPGLARIVIDPQNSRTTQGRLSYEWKS